MQIEKGSAMKVCFCSPIHHHTAEGPTIAAELSSPLDGAGGERPLQRLLTGHPEALGWRFSWGASPTVVIPQFRLGSEFIPDYVIVDAPQWISVYLVEMESAQNSPFTKDGSYSKRLVTALRQTGEWRQWLAENWRYFGDKLSTAISGTK